MRSRDWLTQRLTLLGFEVLPSMANFVFARHPNERLQCWPMAYGLERFWFGISTSPYPRPTAHHGGNAASVRGAVDALAALTNNDPAR